MRAITLYNPKLESCVPLELTLLFQITAAKTVSLLPMGNPMLVAFDAIASQTTIDNFLGTSSEFTIAQFDATALGADAMGVIVDMHGQAKSLLGFEASCYSASGLETLVQRASLNGGLTDSTLATECKLGSSGNIACRINWGNSPDFDGLTSGLIKIKFYWLPK